MKRSALRLAQAAKHAHAAGGQAAASGPPSPYSWINPEKAASSSGGSEVREAKLTTPQARSEDASLQSKITFRTARGRQHARLTFSKVGGSGAQRLTRQTLCRHTMQRASSPSHRPVRTLSARPRWTSLAWGRCTVSAWLTARSQTTHLPPSYTPVHNPSGPPSDTLPRSAGGSSGGSAAAVAEGSCWA